ncbi:hypothetical protein [Caldisericum exile]|nr:hypothetical protein [Caldisericum exile]
MLLSILLGVIPQANQNTLASHQFPELKSNVITPYMSKDNLSILKSTAKVYEELLKSSQNKTFDSLLNVLSNESKTFNELISGKTVIVNVPQNSKPPIKPEWCIYIPMSGSVPKYSQRDYGPYSNADWINISLKCLPNYTITLYITDITNNTIVARVTTANGSVSLSSNLSLEHSYDVHIFNSGSGDVSYSGQITLSIK